MPPSKKQHFTYILQCKNGSYYTGYTTDLKKRFKDHKAGVGAKYTRAFGVVKILYHEVFADKSASMKREAEIKSWNRAKKEALIRRSHKKLVPSNLSGRMT